MIFTETDKIRYLAPIKSFQSKAKIVLPLALIFDLMLEQFAQAVHLMLKIEPLIFMLVEVAVFADFITGLLASLRRGDSITSLHARQSVSKIIEYGAFIGLVSFGANAWAHYVPIAFEWMPGIIDRVFRNADTIGAFVVFLIEGYSTLENVFLSPDRRRKLRAAVGGLYMLKNLRRSLEDDRPRVRDIANEMERREQS